MTGKTKYIIWAKGALLLAAAAAIVCAGVWLYRGVSEAKIEIGSDPHINVTLQKIAEIKSIRQWEFVSVADEVVIDTMVERWVLPDCRLTCIYYGRLSIGIDLDRTSDDWLENRGDTLTVRLPRPTLLDEKFIDESATRVFYECGEWRPAARRAMLRRASVKMRANALTDENLRHAEEAAKERFTRLFKAMGAREVNITFEP